MKVMLITAPFGFNTLLPMLTSKLGVFMDLQANVFDSKADRNIVEHQVPGREGGPQQDMGSNATIFTISGKWIAGNKPSGMVMDTGTDVITSLATGAVGVLESISTVSKPLGSRYAARGKEIVLNQFKGFLSRIGWNWLRVVDIERLYYSQTPIMLMCDLAPGSLCLIKHKHFVYRGGLPNVYEYTLILKEFSTPLIKAATAPLALAPVTDWGDLGH